MLEGKDDKSTVMGMLDKYKVDYSKLVDNHKPSTRPLVVEETLREELETLRISIKDIHTEALDVKGTKPVLVSKLGDISCKLKVLEDSLSNFFLSK